MLVLLPLWLAVLARSPRLPRPARLTRTSLLGLWAILVLVLLPLWLAVLTRSSRLPRPARLIRTSLLRLRAIFVLVLFPLWLAVPAGTIRVGLRSRATLVLFPFRLAVTTWAVRVSRPVRAAGLFRLRTVLVLVLVLIPLRLAGAIGTIGVGYRSRAILVLVPFWLAVPTGTIRVVGPIWTSRFLRLRAVAVLPAKRLWVLQTSLNLFAGLGEQPRRLAQALLYRFSGLALGLHHLPFLILDRLSRLVQRGIQTICWQASRQPQRLLQVCTQPQHGGLVGHLASQCHLLHFPYPFLDQSHIHRRLAGRIGRRVQTHLLHRQLGRVQHRPRQAVGRECNSAPGRPQHQADDHSRFDE